MLNFRLVIERVVEHSRKAFKQFKLSELPSKGIGGRVGTKLGQSQQLTNIKSASCSALNTSLISSGGGSIFKFLRPVSQRLFQGFVRKVPTPLWAEARKRSAKRLFGETAPFFALVGITLISGPERGLLTSEDELEALCGDIREAISRAGWIHNPEYWRDHNKLISTEDVLGVPIPEHVFSLQDFELGSVIDKGCNAVVYAAKWKQEKIPIESGLNTKTDDSAIISHSSRAFSDSNMKTIDRFHSSLQNIHSSANVEDCCLINGNEKFSTSEKNFDAGIGIASAAAVVTKDLSLNLSNTKVIDLHKLDLISSLNEIASHDLPRDATLCSNMSLLLSTGSFEKPYKRKKVKFKDLSSNDMEIPEIETPFLTTNERVSLSNAENSTCSTDYPLAVKMMFNYEAESNAPAILSAMYKEMIPARTIQLNENLLIWKQRFLSDKVYLPTHPNIVDMPCVFVDHIPLLDKALNLYPDALPKRINPMGYGRNMSLFCVMKRYDCTLTEYVNKYKLSIRTSLLLLTQLLEAINHLNKYGISHRDLKSDNILLSLSDGIDSPLLVLSDFGCCLTESNLTVAFHSYEADPRRGNSALMAPEVKNAVPGLLSSIQYCQADLWAVGTIAFEIFGLDNPFIPGDKTLLDSCTYKESQVPKLPKNIPNVICHLIYDLLKRNPKQRPSSKVAATICQLSLWAPNKWLNRHALTLPSYSEITRWLLCLSTKVLCEAGSVSPHITSSADGFGALSRNDLADGTCEPTSSSSPTFEHYNANVKKTCGGGNLEYEIVSTFLSRVHYSDIVQAIKWNRAIKAF